MKIPEKLKKELDREYLKAINRDKAKAIKAKERFYKKTIKEFNATNNINIKSFLLKELHNKLMFFCDAKLINRLKSMDVKPSILRWFVSLNQIIKQFKLIEQKGIIIDKYSVLMAFDLHLSEKFSHEILLWGRANELHDGVNMNFITKELFKLRNRRRYSGGDPKRYKNDFEIILNELINEISTQSNGYFTLDSMLESSKGRTEQTILREILENGFYYDTQKISKNKFLSIVYDLFRIVMKDYVMENEDEFNNKTTISESNFERYKARRLKKLIYKT